MQVIEQTKFASAKFITACLLVGTFQIALASQDQEGVVGRAKLEVAAARKLILANKLDKAEPHLLTARTLLESVQATSLEANQLLGFVWIKKGLNGEALELLQSAYKPGKHAMITYLVAVAAARLENRDAYIPTTVMFLDSKKALDLHFGGKENLPSPESWAGKEATAWLMLAASKIDPYFTRQATEEAARLASENAAVEYWQGLVMLAAGNKEDARPHFLAAEAMGRGSLPEMARAKIREIDATRSLTPSA